MAAAGAALFGLVVVALPAATLPEDAAEIMFHSYDGGGVQVTGPALQLRKSFARDFSASANYYVDSISAASIDVVTSASPYSERREEVGTDLQWLRGDSLMRVGYVSSDESDYESDTYAAGISQQFFGGLSTLSMEYSHGDDVVMRVDTEFRDRVDRDQFSLGLSQVLTPRLVATLDYEAVLETGFLANPYRSARILGAQVPERYPRARNSHAVGLRAVRWMGEGRSLRAGYRWYRDTWQVSSHTLELAGARRIGPDVLAELSYRFYTQDAASFYADDFDREYEYMARDKELSTFTSQALGGRVTWDVSGRLDMLRRGSLAVGYDYMRFDYDDFTDIRNGGLYGFDSHVFEIWFSGWW